jgi:hypothetical protein
MRKAFRPGIMVLLATLASWTFASPARAQEAEALRRELEQMRKQVEALSERLRRLEAQPPPAAPVAAPTPAAGAQPQSVAMQAPTPTPGAPSSAPSVMDLVRPRQPFALYQQRGAGQLLFDMGITGDFIGNVTQRNVDKAGAGTFRGRENRFFPREVELNLFGQIDPYARGEVRIESGEEARGQETGVSLAEAHLTLLTLPFNTQLKIGQMRARYGWSNQLHDEAMPWPDRPGVYRYFFGEEGLSEKGFEATWVPGLPFYLEVLGGLFNGDNETAFGRGRISEPLVTGRVRAFFDLTDEHALQIGASVVSGLTSERQRHTLPGFDVRYKYRPDGWLHPLLTLGGEGIWSLRRREVTRDVVVSEDPLETLAVGNHRTFTRFGWYTYAELQPFRRWAGGVRYDYTELPDRGREWALEPYVSFRPSEFLRFRAGYKLTERSQDNGFSANGASARHVDELFFQATFVLGAHPAHPF